MKRSRLNQFGLAGLSCRNRVHSTNAIGAAPIGRPGWPLFAFCTASIDRNRSALTHSASRSLSEMCAEDIALLVAPCSATRGNPADARKLQGRMKKVDAGYEA